MPAQTAVALPNFLCHNTPQVHLLDQLQTSLMAANLNYMQTLMSQMHNLSRQAFHTQMMSLDIDNVVDNVRGEQPRGRSDESF